jgi:hypothetical protein
MRFTARNILYGQVFHRGGNILPSPRIDGLVGSAAFFDILVVDAATAGGRYNEYSPGGLLVALSVRRASIAFRNPTA